VGFRFPGPTLSIIAWEALNITSYPYSGGCTYISIPPSWYYLPFVFQAIFDLLVFLLCTTKVGYSKKNIENSIPNFLNRGVFRDGNKKLIPLDTYSW
jgi:hypothetical protein